MAGIRRRHDGKSPAPAAPAGRGPRHHRAWLAILPAMALLVAGATAAANKEWRTTAGQPVHNQAGSVRPQSGKEAKPMQQDDSTTPRQPASSESVQDDGDGSTTQVTVNGESITVPANGSYHRSTDDGDAHTDVNVDSRHQASSSGDGASSSSHSSVRINVQSNSSTESVSQ